MATEQELINDAPECLKTLGKRLTDILDSDHWNNIEPLLLDIADKLHASGIERRVRSAVIEARCLKNERNGIAWLHSVDDIVAKAIS